ncbi:MAG: DNA-directed RNA polymerase subunit D [Candidatus Micrarchaeota archaeon]
MKVEITKCDEQEMDFRFTGSSVAFANAVRRIAMSEVPTFAIDSVTFYENTSAFFDEYVANRISLVPLTTDPKYTEKDEISFMLEAQGPSTVYSGSLKSTDKKIEVAVEKIPLLKLTDGQTVRLEAKAKLGIAKKHSKHQACLITYKYKDDKKDEFDFHLESFGQLTPKQILKKTLELLETKCDELEAGLKES